MVTEGESYTVEREFTHGEVETFVDLSGDEGRHHVEPDDEGRLLVHGLLTATLPTQVGGSHDVLAHEMAFGFHRPVRTGERITCEVTYTNVEAAGDDVRVQAEFTCENEAGETVLTGSYAGVVRDGRVD
jgi:acyl dehydratase